MAPRNNLERAIATAWREVLGLARVGVHDNFFELGGSSLLVVKLHGLLKQALGERNLSVMDLFRSPTVDALARHLSQGAHGAKGAAPGDRSAEQVRTRTRTRRESLQQLTQARSQRRGRAEREE